MQLEAHPESKLYDNADLGSEGQRRVSFWHKTHSALTHVKDIHLLFRAFDNLMSMLKCGSLGNKK